MAMWKRVLIGTGCLAGLVFPAWLLCQRESLLWSEAAAGESALTYPAAFELAIFAEGLNGPRVMAFDPGGTMLVSLPAAGRVVALPDADHDGRADRVIEVLSGLNRPHGLAFSPAGGQQRLYVAETDRLMAYNYAPAKLEAGAAEKIIDLPGGGNHSSRSILLMPPPDEGTILISVGSSCNACEEEDWRRAKILAVNKAAPKLKTFASGLRNAVFMTLHPATKEIWATEMGRDYLGDDLPPDEINKIVAGHDYGWPYCYGDNIPDQDFSNAENRAADCRHKTAAFLDLPAHSAPLGLDFFPPDWPLKYRHNLLVAYHGSWNRTTPTGYKVVLCRFDGQGNFQGQEDFISGWLRPDQTLLGRPVDIKIREKGLIFISDDHAGRIYRLALNKAKE